MNGNRGIQFYLERILAGICALLLAFFVVRNYFLTQWLDWKYLRGPLAPREYYRLGLLDEPIDFEEDYPYLEVPGSGDAPWAEEEFPVSPLESAKSPKDSTAEVENP